MNGLSSDFRQAARGLGHRPGYTLTVVATLALGIGAVTAVFTLLDRVLLRPLPFPDAERLVLVRQQNAQTDWNTSVVDFQAVAGQSTVFDAVAAMVRQETVLTGRGQPQWVGARWVTADFFDVMGVAPARGRAFQPGEDQPSAEPVVVLGHAFAEREFGGVDPIGRTLTLDGETFTVIGVMPAGLDKLDGFGADLWPALRLAAPERRGPFFLGTVARLQPGATLAQAQEELEAISRRIFPLWQAGFQDETARLVPRSLKDAIVGNAGGFLWVAFGAVIAVLLIAIVNCVNLASMRVAERARDLAVRATLGATRLRMLRLLLAESLLLTVLGGAAGVVLARLMLDGYRALGPALPRLSEIAIDSRVLLVAGAATLLCAVTFGLLPLLFARFEEQASAARQSHGASGDRARQAIRNGLVALEFSLALPLLAAAGLLIGSLLRLQHVDPGFEAERVLTARVQLPETEYPEVEDRLRFWNRALPELSTMPGVSAAGLAGAVPPQCGCSNNFDLLERRAEQGNQPQSPWIPVTAGYFDALGLRLVDGRWFGESDVPDSMPVIVVSSSWAQRYFPGESAVGKQLYEGGDTSTPITIAGVVSDVKFDGLKGPGDVVYAPISQGWNSNPAYVYLRTDAAPMALAATLRTTLERLDPDLAPAELATMQELLGGSLQSERHWAAVITGFALAAVLLSALGVFGVLAWYVVRQYREIGIRRALGADGRSVVGFVLRRGFACAAAGTALGLVLALFLTRGLEALLFEVERLEVFNLLAASVVLLAIALAACWLPARRAARIDPAVTLRHE